MKNVCIQSWYGRLGNNILQVKNALHLAFYKQYNVILPKHKYFTTTYIIINKDIRINYPKVLDEQQFYSPTNKFVPQDVCTTQTPLVIQKLITIFKYPPPIPLPNHSLVLHIRSGDIFEQNPHPLYITPPLSYYTDIIQSHPHQQIILLAENTSNPCIPALLKMYPTIIYRQQTLEQDIQIILAATTIVISFGSMINSLLLVSSNIQTVYMPSYNFMLDLPGKNIHLIDLDDYKDRLTPWKNTPDQRQIMLTYTRSEESY